MAASARPMSTSTSVNPLLPFPRVRPLTLPSPLEGEEKKESTSLFFIWPSALLMLVCGFPEGPSTKSPRQPSLCHYRLSRDRRRTGWRQNNNHRHQRQRRLP